jgi:hypothetical protein
MGCGEKKGTVAILFGILIASDQSGNKKSVLRTPKQSKESPKNYFFEAAGNSIPTSVKAQNALLTLHRVFVAEALSD